ncbi:hypothetical protein [Erythrobacter rubeus]|uniref:Uncharacterized protein n=1 Tax=Erythrobacter rubeus TaxID=2760803 RepID=A0ABR8KW39_9SPHN|nr:hypothetical protein [Erythrobacter rubeus]MBD2843433.1 hypothetical protein [Erythrobacter rubeus]
MFATLFKNPKAALAYVGITLGSVLLFVGTEDDPGSLGQVMKIVDGEGTEEDELRTRRQVIDGQSGRNRLRPETGFPVEFSSDEDLIDAAEGFDPAPSDDTSGFDPNPELPQLSADRNRHPEREGSREWSLSASDD